jgi:hypothetical protein
MGSPFVGTNLEHAPSMGVGADGAPVIGAANPTDVYYNPMMGRTPININGVAMNAPAAAAAPAANMVYEAPLGTAAQTNVAAAQPAYGAMPVDDMPF